MSGRRYQGAPSYRLHKPSGQAVVTLNREVFYLGAYGSSESREAYECLITRWIAGGRQPIEAKETQAEGLSIYALVAAYWKHAEIHYRDVDGEPTAEIENIRRVLRHLCKLFGSGLASDFGPKKLKLLRELFIQLGWTRGHVNQCVGRVKRCFKWGVEEELVPPAVHQALSTVRGLQNGRSQAKEGRKVLPVSEADMRAVLPVVSRQVAAMIELQWLTGMRSGEVITMRGEDIEADGAVWIYRPVKHKMGYADKSREIALGPQAQALLREFVKLDRSAFLFSPKDAEAEWRAGLKKGHNGNRINRKAKKAKPRKKPGDAYSVNSYRRAIDYACKKAGIDRWHPHQLRHSAATRIRKGYGIEAARAVLGHSSAVVTELYAEIDRTKTREVMERVG